MEIPLLTAWETKERAGLLALETEEWREKRLIAEDPNTTADVLSHLVSEADAATGHAAISNADGQKIHLFLQSVAAHPNISPDALMQVFDLTSAPREAPLIFSLFPIAVCRNPITPFITLEIPDFWQKVDNTACQNLLARDDLPLSVVSSLTRYKSYDVAPTALLHVSQADWPRTSLKGAWELTLFWQAFCAETSGFLITAQMKQEHSELTQWHIVPSWAAGERPVKLSPFRVCEKRDIMWLVEKGMIETSYSRFVNFVLNMHTPRDLSSLHERGVSYNWTWRLVAALRLPLADTPFQSDPWNRSPLQLLRHLAHDGNRFVRWAAQTRLADPDFVFTWQE